MQSLFGYLVKLHILLVLVIGIFCLLFRGFMICMYVWCLLYMDCYIAERWC